MAVHAVIPSEAHHSNSAMFQLMVLPGLKESANELLALVRAELERLGEP